MNKDFNAKLNLLIKSEKALFKLEMRKKGRQTVFISIALLAVLIALVMLNVTGFLYLKTTFSMQISAAILSGINLLLAILFFIIASRQDSSGEAESIQDIRDFAWGQLSSDIDGVKQQVIEFSDGVQRIKSGINTVVNRDPFGLKNVLPLIQALNGMRKKHQGSSRSDKHNEDV